MADGKALTSILFPHSASTDPAAECDEPACFRDLKLDSIVARMIAGREDYGLEPLFHVPLSDPHAIAYRQAVIRDLADPGIAAAMTRFTETMRQRSRQRRQADVAGSRLEAQRWQFDAAASYRRAVVALCDELETLDPVSQGLTAVRDALRAHVHAPAFAVYCAEMDRVRAALDAVRYAVRIREDGFEVQSDPAGADLVAEADQVLAPLREAESRETADQRGRGERTMDPVETRILDAVARLHPQPFAALARFCADYGDTADPVILRFERELQFVRAVRAYVDRLERQGLAFCYPHLRSDKTGIGARDAVDLALADQLAERGERIVSNDFHWHEGERVLVVTGPNQGGKTTFARSVGQLHYLARLGCPVPAREARLLLTDRVFTHFDREERVSDGGGKLENDLARIGWILEAATERSLVILNEPFHATQLRDAVTLTTRTLEALMERDALGVCVTFIDEVSRLDARIASLVSTLDGDEPHRRSYRVRRLPADGHAHARSLAEAHGLTYERLRERLPR